MTNILQQRRFLKKRHFELTDTGLKIIVTKPFNFFEEEFPFENITKRTAKRRSPNRLVLIISVIALIGFFITFIGKLDGDKTIGWDDVLFYVVFLMFQSILFWITFSNNINLILSDGRYIAFIANSPNKKAVKGYMDLIFAKQKQVLLDKYGQKDSYLSNEQLAINIKWLLDKEVITDDEYMELTSKYFKNNSIEPIGFKFNSQNN